MIVKSCSYSSDKKLARCEMQFSYRYAEQLKPRVKKVGLYRGDWIHQLLEAKYKTGDWKKKLAELKKKLWDPIFDEEKEEYGLDFVDRVVELMEHYDDHWSEDEKSWKVIEVEKDFELQSKFGFPIRWKADLVVKDGEVLTLVETKAKKTIPDSSERILQAQVHAYAYLLTRVGLPVKKIIWNYLRTSPVPRPKINKNGSLSVRQIQTDQRGYLKSLKEAELMPTSEEDIIGLNNHLKTLPETLSLERVTNTVNLRIGKMFVKDWIERHRRALGIDRPLRSFNYNCKWDCDYYILCQADMRGDVDRKLIIKRDFVTNISTKEELK